MKLNADASLRRLKQIFEEVLNLWGGDHISKCRRKREDILGVYFILVLGILQLLVESDSDLGVYEFPL